MNNISKRLDRIKKISASAKRRSNLYSDLAEFEHKTTSNSLRALRKASAPGGKTLSSRNENGGENRISYVMDS